MFSLTRNQCQSMYSYNFKNSNNVGTLILKITYSGTISMTTVDVSILIIYNYYQLKSYIIFGTYYELIIVFIFTCLLLKALSKSVKSKQIEIM